jgi:hypothetical protein
MLEKQTRYKIYIIIIRLIYIIYIKAFINHLLRFGFPIEEQNGGETRT